MTGEIWGESMLQASVARIRELDRLVWGEGGQFNTRRDDMANKMEDILGKTLCPKCDKYILIESIKEHQRVGCRVPLELGIHICHMCETAVPIEVWPEHYTLCKINQQRKDIMDTLDEAQGHYESIGQQLGALVDRKNKALWRLLSPSR